MSLTSSLAAFFSVFSLVLSSLAASLVPLSSFFFLRNETLSKRKEKASVSVSASTVRIWRENGQAIRLLQTNTAFPTISISLPNNKEVKMLAMVLTWWICGVIKCNTTRRGIVVSRVAKKSPRTMTECESVEFYVVGGTDDRLSKISTTCSQRWVCYIHFWIVEYEWKSTWLMLWRSLAQFSSYILYVILNRILLVKGFIEEWGKYKFGILANRLTSSTQTDLAPPSAII